MRSSRRRRLARGRSRGPANAAHVATFLAKGEALRQKGVLAAFSSDAAAIQKELADAMHAVKAERVAAEAAGRHGAYCPHGAAILSMEEMRAALLAVPPARRVRTPVKDAVRAALARKYPCGV